MLLNFLFLPLLPFTARALPVAPEIDSAISFAPSLVPRQAFGSFNILLGNADGWADANIRELWSELTALGYRSFISAPPDDRTGHGVLEDIPHPMEHACQYDSCPKDVTITTGNNASQPDIHWVNALPVTAMKYGISKLAPDRFGFLPDIALSGPNDGENMGIMKVSASGTMGAAAAAAKMGVAAIAFSSKTAKKTPWNAPLTLHSRVYAELAILVTEAVLGSGAPYLPEGTFLNVKFPKVEDGLCDNSEQHRFVLTRLFHSFAWTSDDVETCGKHRLPVDSDVVGRKDHWYVSISVVKSNSMTTAEAEQQADVLERLGSILECVGDDHDD